MSDSWSVYDYLHAALPIGGAGALGWIGWIHRTQNRHGIDIELLQERQKGELDRLEDHSERLKMLEKAQGEILTKLSSLPTRGDLRDGFFEINRRVDSAILAVRDVILSRRPAPKGLRTDDAVS